MYFEYGAQETEYLARKDKRLGAAIEQIGHIDRAVDGDLFSSVVHQIVGQQISTKAQETIWQRMQQTLGTVDAGHILAAGVPELQKLGITYRKAEYITDFARKVQTGECRIEEIWQMPDEEVIRVLSSLKGIGVWTSISFSHALRQASPVTSVCLDPDVVPESGEIHVLLLSYTISSCFRSVFVTTICTRTVPSPCPIHDAPE